MRAETGEEGRLTPGQLAELIHLVDTGVVSGSAAKQVLEAGFRSGKDPRALVEELGLGQVSDVAALEEAVGTVIGANPAAVADYRGGKLGALNFLKGQVMKATRGKANPGVVEELLRKRLG
jgi:aspartyl-tRNA(Asn)/glutamyl-tRNA(Gln) amidotransferase subunit B